MPRHAADMPIRCRRYLIDIVACDAMIAAADDFIVMLLLRAAWRGVCYEMPYADIFFDAGATRYIAPRA